MRIVRHSSLAVAFSLLLFSSVIRGVAADLVVDGGNGNGSYIVNATAVYDNIYVGENTFGMVTQTGSGGYFIIASTNLILGDKQGSTGFYNLSGTPGSPMNLQAAGLLAVGNGGSGTFNQGADSNVSTAQLVFQNVFVSPGGVYNLNGGALYVGQISSNVLPGSQFGVSNSVMNLNGGTINAMGSNATFMQGLTAAYLRNGGVVFGTQAAGGSDTVAQPLLHSNQANDNAVDGGLTKVDPHTLILTGANTYTGPTAINGGVLNAGSASALGNGGTISFGGGTLQYSAASAGVDFSARFSSAANQAVSLDTNGQNATIGFGFGGSGTSLTKLGAGTLTINGANTYTGATNLNAGTVVVNNPAALGSGGSIVFGGGTLQYGDASRTDAQYNAADFSTRFSTAASQAYSVNTNGHNITYAAALTSSGGTLNKSGAGTLTLNGNNTYTGPTNVTAGTLLLNGINSGRGTIFVDGTNPILGGTGSTLAAIIVKNGTVNPGGNGGAAGSAATIGELRFATLSLGNGSTVSLDVNSPTSYDLLTSGGNVVLGGSTLSINLNPNAIFSVGQTLDLIHLTAGGLTGTFAGITNGATYSFGGDPFRAVYTSTDFELVAVPEPSTEAWLVGALTVGGGLGLAGRRRVRQRSRV